MMQCWSCGEPIESTSGKIMRGDECGRCSAWLRCCRNCEFFDEFAPNQCREPQADLQPDKEAANACDYFRASGINRGAKGKRSKGDFDNLFKD